MHHTEPKFPDEIAMRYRVESLGIPGGMGVVYRGTDLLLQRCVAIKHVPYPETVPTTKYLREAQMIAKVESPHVMQIHHAVDSPSGLWMIGEWIAGESLAALPKGIDQMSVLAITLQVLKGFKTLHGLGIIHRDVKPSNLMVSHEGVVKIIDFGVAFDQNQMSGRTIAGTVRYMHPEILSGKSASVRSDLYALGIMLIELIIGEPFWRDHSPIEHFRNATQKIRPRVRAALTNVLPALASCIEEMIFGNVNYDAQIRALSLTFADFAGDDRKVESFLQERLLDRFAPSAEIETFVAKSLKPKRRPAAIWLYTVASCGLVITIAYLGISPTTKDDRAANQPISTPAVAVVAPLSDAAAPSAAPISPENRSIPKPTNRLAAPRESKVLKLENSAVTIRTNAWADLRIDGQHAGRVPRVSPIEMKVGKHRLRFESPLVETLEVEVNVPATPTSNMNFQLTRKTGELLVKTEGSSSIELNGEMIQVQGTQTLKVPFGRTKVGLVKNGRVVREQIIDIHPNEPPQTVRF